MRGALTKPLLVVRGHPRPGLTSSTGHHVGHEVTGWQQGGNNLTGLLCLLTTQLARDAREARGTAGNWRTLSVISQLCNNNTQCLLELALVLAVIRE